ncbi:hypothetical protein Sango_2991100 [Sesamum angolense]|uniref:Rhamnogalacturonan lyase domain-containing protein n=1 Tax=Sesamum angolense TaxID=2727404 RepID=A0AAE1T4Q4_9LAMI|nr:hypothetical protein Sango_2991100 [Sesamum angolense]
MVFFYQGYQFWTQTDREGNFLIKNVIPGTYSLFAWVPGTIGDYKHGSDITISPGCIVEARNVVFEAPRKGATLWEIGVPDRTAAEFFIPNPDPKFKIHNTKDQLKSSIQMKLLLSLNSYKPMSIPRIITQHYHFTGSDNTDYGQVTRIIIRTQT